MRNGNRIPYEKAETAKRLLMELIDVEMEDNAPIKEIQQLDTIISKLEIGQTRGALRQCGGQLQEAVAVHL